MTRSSSAEDGWCRLPMLGDREHRRLVVILGRTAATCGSGRGRSMKWEQADVFLFMNGRELSMLVADRDVRVVSAADGELLRHLMIDPTRNYQRQSA